MRTWFAILIILGLSGALTISRFEIKALKAEAVIAERDKTDAVTLAKNEVWEKQKLVSITSDSIKTSKVWYAKRLDSLARANHIKVERLESVLMLQSHWIDSLREKAVMGTAQLVDPSDTNKVNPLLRVPASKLVKCWGFKGEIITRDPESYLNILEKSTVTFTDLTVVKGKKFLWWTIRKPKYMIFNDCGEVEITNVKIE